MFTFDSNVNAPLFLYQFIRVTRPLYVCALFECKKNIQKPFSIRHTLINQTWHYLDKNFTRIHISPYGMKEYLKELLTKERNLNKNAIPSEVKKALGLTDDSSLRTKGCISF